MQIKIDDQAFQPVAILSESLCHITFTTDRKGWVLHETAKVSFIKGARVFVGEAQVTVKPGRRLFWGVKTRTLISLRFINLSSRVG